MFAAAALAVTLAASAVPWPLRTDLHGDLLPPGAVARLGTVRLRATPEVKALAFSPDGKRLASRGSYWIEVWDVATGKRLWSAPRAYYRCQELAFSPDSKHLLTAGADTGHVLLWEAATGERLAEFHFSKQILALAFSPNNRTFAVVTEHTSIHVAAIDIPGAPPRQLGEIGQLDTAVVTWSPDGKVLAVAGNQGRVWLWDPGPTPKAPRGIDFKAPVRGLVFAPTGDALAVVTDAEVRWVNVATLKSLRTFMSSQQPLACALSADGKRLSVAFRDKGATRTWDVTTGKLHNVFTRHRSTNAAAFSADGRLLALTHWDQRIDLWNADTGKPWLVLDGHGAMVDHLTFLPDGSSVATTGDKGTVLLWDSATGKVRNQFRHADGFLYAAYRCFGRDGASLYASAGPEQFGVWDLTTGTAQKFPIKLGGIPWELRDVASTGKLVALRTADEVLVWDLQAGKVRQRFGPLKSPSRAIFSPDGQRLVTQVDRDLHVWDVASGRQLWRLEGQTATFRTWLPDGKQLIIEDMALEGGYKCFLHDAATGKALDVLPYSRHHPRFAFSPDQRLMLAANFLGRVTLYESATRLPLWSFSACEFRGKADYGVSRQLGAVAFARDGRRFAVAHADTSVLVYDLLALVPDNHGKTLTRTIADGLWTTLAGGDGEAVFRASMRLVKSPAVAVALFRDHLKPTPQVADAHLKQLLADLDAKAFPRREAAAKELRQLGDVAEPALRQLHAKPPSLEVGRRVALLLEPLDASYKKFPSPLLRIERAVQILEQVGTPEARELVQTLAKGDPRSRQTRMGLAALERWPR